MPRRLLAGLALALMVLAIGFWLKWRLISPFDPDSWYLAASSQFGYTDLIGIYSERDVGAHPFPYSQLRLEYPPVVGLIIYLTSFAPGIQGFFAANYLILTLAGLGTLYLLHRLNPAAKLWYLAATPPLALYAGLNWDLIAVFFTVGSLLLFQRRRDAGAAALLALGVWSKLFPALLLPAFLWLRYRQNDRSAVISMLGVFSVVSLVINLPFILLSPVGWGAVYGFHSYRPPDGGSLWHALPELPIPWVNVLSATLTGIALLEAVVLWLRREDQTATLSLATITFFVLVDKVSSPQYHLWLLPLLALVPAPLWLLLAFGSMDLAYYTICFGGLFLGWGGQSAFYASLAKYEGLVGTVRLLILAMMVIWSFDRLRATMGGETVSEGAVPAARPSP